ncbi:MAG: hypothetical protein JNG88_11940 [Phycisphaerales bacterium]|nr:hypothetical protein [Phycisphaerales bacterium]
MAACGAQVDGGAAYHVCMSEAECPYVSRGGLKLAAALRAFDVNPSGWVCADFGCHVGGFVDCLLQHGAARVYAIDPGYGILDSRLRRDARGVVCERVSAMHWQAPEPCDLITIDAGWTVQRLVLPAARRGLREGGAVISLIKPHYEAAKALLRGGVLPGEHQERVLAQVRADAAADGWSIRGEIESPIRGQGGNTEYLWHLRRIANG